LATAGGEGETRADWSHSLSRSQVVVNDKQPEHLLPDIETLGTLLLQKTPCTVRFKPLKHLEAQEVSVQSKTPKSFTFGSRIDRTFGFVAGTFCGRKYPMLFPLICIL
jgi:hypothetical protein